MSITPRGMSIQEAYRLYRDNGLIVNRKYQRKLVWKRSEKQYLIDSIINDYPIPLILLAESNINGKQTFEIIDGMQRLNAIFSFIENAFSVNEMYFDVNELTRARQASEKKLFKVIEKEGTVFLSPTVCADILDYQLAITVFPSKSEDQITDVFGRINSGGKQLSSQEKRQAGMTDEFSLLIRELASEIRGDSSKNILSLSEMPEISIDNARDSLGYALNAEKIFWCYQGVLWANNLRDSEDEEMLVDICASIVLNEPIPKSKKYFDKIYDSSEDIYDSIRREFRNYGRERLLEEIKVTFSIFKDVINKFDSEEKALRRVVSPKGTNPIKETFFAIFMAFHKLVIVEEKTPDDHRLIMNALKGLHKQIIATANTSKTENRIRNIDSVTGLIQKFFIKKEQPILKHGAALAIDFENSLRRSRIETTRYECKQGLMSLDEKKRVLDKQLLDKIVNTICGIANVGPDADGYIFIGVADTEKDAIRIKQLDKIEPIKISNRYVVGLERELCINSSSEDDYMAILLSHIKKSELSNPLKSQILTQVDYVTFKGLSIIRLKIPAQTDLSSVGDIYYTREHSSTIFMEGPKLLAASKLFNK